MKTIETQAGLRAFTRITRAPVTPAPALTASNITPATLARLRAEGTVCRCLDCDFVGIGRMTTLHMVECDDHRLVTEHAYALLTCRECGVVVEGDRTHDVTCSHHINFYEPPDGGCYF